MVFEKCPITERINEYRGRKIVEKFPELENCGHSNFLSLWKYLNRIPEKCFDKRAAHDIYHILLNKTDNEIKEILSGGISKLLNIAYKSLNEINSLRFHDHEKTKNEYELMSWIDTQIHPNYLKLIESVFANLILLIASYENSKSGKELGKLKVFQRVLYLEKTGLGYLSEPYERTVRNAIAHGNVVYKHRDIIYSDWKGEVVLPVSHPIFLFDRLLDICNGLALGMTLYFFTKFENLLKQNVKLPQAILVEELVFSTEAPGWKVTGCLESEITENRTQLMVYTRDRFLDAWKAQYHAFRAAVLAEKLAPGYDRYFISLKSKFGKLGETGFAPFIGSELRKLRAKGAGSIEDYTGVLEEGLFFFFPKIKLPRFIFKISNFLTVFKIHYRVSKEEMKEYFRSFELLPRYLKLHRTKYHAVINGSLVVIPKKPIPFEIIIRKNAKLIIKKAIRNARKKTKFLSLSKYLPVGYVRVNVLSKDFRLRDIIAPGLIPELLCTLEIKRLKRIKAPDIWGGIPEKTRGVKIVWNKNAEILDSTNK